MHTQKSSSLSSEHPIGVFDSGVGGLTALCKLAELLPYENLIYLGDTARVPYGSRSAQTICTYAEQCLQFLLSRSVKLVLVACNTMSAVALSLLQRLSPVPVIGVIQPTVLAALQPQSKNLQRIGIIGTKATVQSKAYEVALKNLAQETKTDITTYAQACPLFVPLVEEGLQEHPATYAIAEEYLAPLKKAQIETLILGCTHYPLLKNMIQNLMPNVVLIDSSEQAAIEAAKFVATQTSSLQKTRTIECYTTDDTPTFTRFVEQLLHLPVEKIHEISLQS